MKNSSSAHFLVLVAFGLLICSAANLSGQTPGKNIRRQGEQYLDLGLPYKAAAAFELYCPSRPKDDQAWLWWAQSQYESNDLDGALQSLEHLAKGSKKADPEVILLMAKSLHQKHEFVEAIKHFKMYLAIAPKDQKYQEVVNDIKRCASGLKYNFISDEVLIENMGAAVNSEYDDFAPVESPNFTSRVYFSSIRALRVQDRFDDAGSLEESWQGIDSDMFGTEIINGAWSKSEPLNPDLNTPRHEVLQDFSKDGMVAIFTRGEELSGGEIWVDSVNALRHEAQGTRWQNPPFSAEEKVRGFYFFSDSVVIFSSAVGGGFGGYDLYLSRRTNRGWSIPLNLGEKVNTPFDEVTPYLCPDGRTLYFSSDRLTSIGGFDVFKCTFDNRSTEWMYPQNLGRPMNSAGNDLFFRLSTSGTAAYLSSDRKSGLGRHDIYSAYFKNPMLAMMSSSIPTLFADVRDFQLFSESLVKVDEASPNNETKMASFDMPFLLFRDDQVVTPQNLPKLEKLLGFLKTYPHTKLEIISHSDQTAVSNFDLYFAIKRAEQVADYLRENGFKSSNTFLKGLGGNYPMALNELNGKDNETGRFYNRRVDFRIKSEDQLPIRIVYDFPQIVEAMRDKRHDAYLHRIEGLSYRVQFAVLDQLYKGDLIGKFPDSMIEKNEDQQDYAYTSGLFQTFGDALKHLGEIKTAGHTNAKIIPYLDGLRINNGDISEQFLKNYPDLKNYLLYLN
jgi:outer membrane protein OmpA-like peptidoglycan-associated protein